MTMSRNNARIATAALFSADGLKLLGQAELPRPEPREHHEGKPPARK